MDKRYLTQQEFFCELQRSGQAEIIFSRMKYLALNHYFVDFKGDKRPFPTDQESMAQSVKKWLFKNKKTTTPDWKLFETIKKGFDEALEELDERLACWLKDRVKGVRKTDSFAFLSLDWRVCRAFLRSGVKTVRDVMDIPDHEILEIKGINLEQLIQIRRVINR